MSYLVSSEEEDLDVEEVGASGSDADDALYINNTDGLKDKLEEFRWPENLLWQEGLVVEGAESQAISDVHDDLERELAFYKQALAATKQSVTNFEQLGMDWRRPTDYYAEMVKSDQHMVRVKQQLTYEQKRIEASEQRRKSRDSRKFQKQLQAAKRQEQGELRKRRIEAVTKLRKQRKQMGYKGSFDVDMELEKIEHENTGEMLRKGAAGPSKKRQYKDAKYGYGGRVWKAKRNDSESAGNMGSFKGGRFSEGGGGRKRHKKNNRPGKARRAAARSMAAAGK